MMTKNELVTYLENRLSVLNKAERDDIINEYLQHIENKLSEGMTESEAISTLGNIADMVNETLSAYNVDPEYDSNSVQSTKLKGYNIKNIISNGLVKIRAALKAFTDYILGQKASELLLFLLKTIILFCVLCALFGAGFLVVELLIEGLDALTGTRDIFEGVLNVLYIIIVLPTFVYIFIRYISMHIKKNKKASDVKTDLSAIKKTIGEKADEYKREREERRQTKEAANRSFYKDICSFVKRLVSFLIKAAVFCIKLFFVLFCLIPAAFMLMGSIVLFAFLLVFAVMGYPCIGFCIAMLGFDMSAVSIFVILIKLLFFRKKEAAVNE